MIKKFLKKIPRIGYSFASVVAVSAINYSIIHSPLVFVYVCVLLAHELGHYFAAKRHNANPKLPIFIPLPFILIAMVYVEHLTDDGIKDIALYGPVAGFVAALLFLVANAIYQFAATLPILILACSEIVLNYFGSDGKKYRDASRSLSCQYY
jgi:hypothetical protein